MVKDPLKFSRRPELPSSSLVVAWSEDVGQLGPKVVDYLKRKLGCESFCEIEPVEFFPLGGVAIEDSLVQFPESRFYASPQHKLVLFESNSPALEWYRFLNLMLDVAEHYCHVRELHAIGGMVAVSAHTTPRELVANFNSSETKEALTPFQLLGEFDYETPLGQRPTLNSFLLWAAKRRNIPAVSLWVPIPFYLAGIDDPKSMKRVLAFIDQRLELGIDFSDLDGEIRSQNEKLAEARNNVPYIEESMAKLESNQSLSEEESLRLVNGMDEFLRGK